MSGFIKMSNEIFRFKLSPKALMVYAYLCHKSGLTKTTSPSCEAIARQCSLCRQTILAALHELEAVALIVKHRRMGPKGYRSSRLQITSLTRQKGWFPIPREVFDTSIAPSDFVVYCFLLRSMGARSGEAFPSLSAIAKGTGLSRRRVAQAVTFLRQYTFVNRIKRHRTHTRAWRHNRYLHFTCNLLQKKEARSAKRTSRQCTKINCQPNFTFSIAPPKEKSKFFCRI